MTTETETDEQGHYVHCDLCLSETEFKGELPKGWFSIPNRPRPNHQNVVCAVCSSYLIMEVEKVKVASMSKRKLVLDWTLPVDCPIDDCESGTLIDGRRCHQCGGRGIVNGTVTKVIKT